MKIKNIGLNLFFSVDLLILLGIERALSIPVDNGVLGNPEVECGPTYVTVNFNTQNDFNGHVYVKGLNDNPGCRNDEQGRKLAGLTLPFNTCGVARQRSLNPLGVFVSFTVVIQFHPLFLTKVDRAYKIQCFYMEAPKSVAQGFEVSSLTPGLNTENVPMPVCRYEVLAGGPSGPVISYALIGDQVYHKWTCDTETEDVFCMVVHSCYVDDTAGDRVDLITPEGCAIDRYLLNNLEYPSDLIAGQEAHVFKYADRPTLYFQCQITVTVKEPFGTCERPQCAEPARGKRETALTESQFGTLDVASQTLTALDLDDDTLDIPQQGTTRSSVKASGICVTEPVFGTIVAITSLILIGIIVVSSFLLLSKKETVVC